ncbi:MAG: bifunctional metallophosphatase/5'-nucleotidase [Firmicutes bacterium]|nr:bifunctional metallophosphatase/5'-nucleotidase [Bacillota bacterium]
MKFKVHAIVVFFTLVSCTGQFPSFLDSSSTISSFPSSELDISSGASESSTYFASSSASSSPIITLDFYNLNDFHGAVEHNPSNKEIGINRLSNYFKTQLASNPNSIFLSSGDMWQGSADSNITRGRLVVDAMNHLQFSAMAIGNHEFDWTDSYIIQNQLRSNFPLLGINILEKQTQQRASFADASILIERSGIQIGIIGTIGASLESTILTSAVMNYEFVPYTNLVQEESERLRELGADLIILLNHDGNVESGVLPYVDGVFNGHTHRREVFHIDGKPVYQGQAYGQAISHMRFVFNTVNMVPSFSQNQSGVYTYDYLVSQNRFPTEDPEMKAIYDAYLTNEINPIKNEEIGIAEGAFSRNNLGRLAVEEMLQYGQSVKPEVVASFHNTGGVRASIDDGAVTYGELYKAFPFDNELMIVQVTGEQLSWWLSESLYKRTIPNLTPVNNIQNYWIISINYLTEKHLESSQYPHDLSSALNTHQFIREQLKTRWQYEGTIRAIDYN